MNKIIEWFTKKRMTIVSLLLFLVYIISYYNRILNLPDIYRNFCCVDDRKLNLFLIFLPMFIFSIIFTKLSEKNFSLWKKFSFVFLLIYVILYFISPTQGNDYIWLQRETISFLGFVLYSIISIILIIYKSLKKED